MVGLVHLMDLVQCTSGGSFSSGGTCTYIWWVLYNVHPMGLVHLVDHVHLVSLAWLFIFLFYLFVFPVGFLKLLFVTSCFLSGGPAIRSLSCSDLCTVRATFFTFGVKSTFLFRSLLKFGGFTLYTVHGNISYCIVYIV